MTVNVEMKRVWK